MSERRTHRFIATGCRRDERTRDATRDARIIVQETSLPR